MTESEINGLSDVKAIKVFFETEGYEKVSMDEFKATDKADREELGKLARVAMLENPESF